MYACVTSELRRLRFRRWGLYPVTSDLTSARAMVSAWSPQNRVCVCEEFDITVFPRSAWPETHANTRLSFPTQGAMSSSKTLSIGIGLIGPGLIGKELLRQIHSQADRLRTANGIDLHLVGIANSRKMVASSRAGAIDLANWQEALRASETAVDLGEFAVKVKESGARTSVIIDCTASDAVPELYSRWMLMGVHIVTPNKKLHSGPLPQYTAVKAMQRAGTAHYFYEATCGAGLPVLSTLKGLVETGDRVLKAEGILSGTLSFLFNGTKPGVAFSSVVADARSRGFTEPDPREDLSGSDVARKVAILARESGANVELQHIDVESLVPAALAGASSVDEFMAKLPQYDAEMAARIQAADAAGCVLRYVGVYDADDGGSCSVKLQRYPKDHAFAQLSGTDNIVSFTTARYRDQPLVVRGPGAGPAVTAAGVFADLLMLARFLGASA